MGQALQGLIPAMFDNSLAYLTWFTKISHVVLYEACNPKK